MAEKTTALSQPLTFLPETNKTNKQKEKEEQKTENLKSQIPPPKQESNSDLSGHDKTLWKFHQTLHLSKPQTQLFHVGKTPNLSACTTCLYALNVLQWNHSFKTTLKNQAKADLKERWPLSPQRFCSNLRPNFVRFTDCFQALKDLRNLYGNSNSPDELDIFTGGLLETTEDGPGELFREIIMDQFLRIRHGDRFWYENTDNG